MIWLAVTKACSACGGDLRVRAFSAEPTKEQVAELAGPGTCVRSGVIAVEVDGAEVDLDRFDGEY